MPTYENLLVERADQIATITVNRPKSLNALNSQTLRELTQAVRECADGRAMEIGLVNQVLPKEQLLPRCREIAAKIATRGPLAVARAKRLVERGYDMPLRAANRQEAESFALLFDTEDRREGMRAFVEKRPPKFTGK